MNDSKYVPRELIQYITRSAWVDDAADYLIEIGIYNPDEFKHVCKVADMRLQCLNVDLNGDIKEIDAQRFIRKLIRKELED